MLKCVFWGDYQCINDIFRMPMEKITCNSVIVSFIRFRTLMPYIAHFVKFGGKNKTETTLSYR